MEVGRIQRRFAGLVTVYIMVNVGLKRSQNALSVRNLVTMPRIAEAKIVQQVHYAKEAGEETAMLFCLQFRTNC